LHYIAPERLVVVVIVTHIIKTIKNQIEVDNLLSAADQRCPGCVSFFDALCIFFCLKIFISAH
jgi:hypothetical protein|tara:strand:- start:970 stop:1158 length:189 start_codon:yes stop_codon:yes gene_type:complete